MSSGWRWPAGPRGRSMAPARSAASTGLSRTSRTCGTYPRKSAARRISAYDEVQGGYLDDIGQQRSNVDRTLRRGARASLFLQPFDAWSVNLTVAGQHLRSDDTHYTNPGLGLN